jgi:hypothetical protein
MSFYSPFLDLRESSNNVTFYDKKNVIILDSIFKLVWVFGTFCFYFLGVLCSVLFFFCFAFVLSCGLFFKEAMWWVLRPTFKIEILARSR